MTFRWNGKTPREILRISSPSEFFDWLPQSLTDGVALFALSAFALFPVVIAGETLFHKNFNFMVADNMDLLDYVVFPLVAVVAAFVYAMALGKLWYQKHSPLDEIQKQPTFLLFLFLLAWMSVGTVAVNGLTRETLRGSQLRHENFLLQIEYFAGFFALGVALRNERWKLWFLRGVTVVGVFLVPCAFYLWKHIYASPIFYDWRPTLCCIWTNINYYGYVLTVFISLSAALFAGAESRGWRVFYGVALVANSVTLCYNNTFGAWIGSLCGCLFVVAAYRLRDGKFNRRALAALGLFVLSMLAAGIINGKLLPNVTRLSNDVGLILTEPDSEATQNAGSGRWFIWLRCMELIRRYPLFGIGLDGIVAKEGLLEFTGNSRPHNEYMQYALFYGVPAGILYTLGCAGVYVRAFRRRARLDNVTLAALGAAFGYLCGAFFGLTVYNTAPYLFIMLGLGYVLE